MHALRQIKACTPLEPLAPTDSTCNVADAPPYPSPIPHCSEEDYNSEHDDYNLSLPPLQDEYAVMQVQH